MEKVMRRYIIRLTAPCLGSSQLVVEAQSLYPRRLSITYFIGPKSASHLRDVSSRLGCLPAPDDYSKQVRAWFLTSEYRGNTESTRTSLLGTFRTLYADLKELVRILSP
ncbi:hypothetical protein PIB30_045071 [Stylosanthes scabra]|uniref:Uncharacterized protein n=1 Tax=Stylosanthes scabra TaxID=79078 RepID=A0ABU6VGS4_9FABA|nr:hypothetical protein [Stylosanthes scabra]